MKFNIISFLYKTHARFGNLDYQYLLASKSLPQHITKHNEWLKIREFKPWAQDAFSNSNTISQLWGKDPQAKDRIGKRSGSEVYDYVSGNISCTEHRAYLKQLLVQRGLRKPGNDISKCTQLIKTKGLSYTGEKCFNYAQLKPTRKHL